MNTKQSVEANPTLKNLNIAPDALMVQNYLAGTLSGWLDQTGRGLWFDDIAEGLAERTGKRIVQRQRGCVVWQ